jgi:hypothetical protein
VKPFKFIIRGGYDFKIILATPLTPWFELSKWRFKIQHKIWNVEVTVVSKPGDWYNNNNNSFYCFHSSILIEYIFFSCFVINGCVNTWTWAGMNYTNYLYQRRLWHFSRMSTDVWNARKYFGLHIPVSI